jgi:hypothetical protein
VSVTDTYAGLEAQLASLGEALRRLEGRVSALERGATAASAEAAREAALAAAMAEAERRRPVGEATVTAILSFVGRTLLILAGAFVLRALTDGGRIPVAAGAALGLLYAGAWIGFADRAGRRGETASAGFYGVAAVLIGFPLLFEAATRFQLLSPAVATLLLALLTGVALAVAAWRGLSGLAWAIGLGGAATAAALMVVGGRFLAPATYLILLGVGALWIGYTRDWFGLRWPLALATDLVLVAVAMRAVAPTVVEGPRVAFFLQALLIAAYLGSIAVRTLLLGRDVVPFEIAQTAASLVVGLGGAIYVAARTGMGSAGFGAATIVLGVASYAVAFAFVEARQKGSANFYFYATVGILMVLVGSGLALPPAACGVAWGALAVVAAALARWKGRRSLALHGVAYGLAAAFGSGLVVHAARVLRSAPGTPWDVLPAASILVLACVAGCAWIQAGDGERTTPAAQVAQLLLDGVVALSAAGILVGWIAPAVAAALPEDASPGAVAAVRTGVLVAGVLVLAWAGRTAAWREAGWLAYPLLVAIALKILTEDLPRSRPATLLFSFGLYGIALILVPRLRGRKVPPPGPAAPA